jgi:hypothetical protein
LTAVAVLSIVLGSIGILTSGATTLYGALMAVASGIARTASVTTTSTATTQGVVTPPGVQGTNSAADADEEDGMPGADRKRVVDVLARVRGLSEVRRGHLDALLAKVGKKVLPLSGDAITERAVEANVTDAGRYPSGSGDASAGSDYFAFARGRVEVDDRHAVFYPTGEGDVVRAAADVDAGDGATTEPDDATAAAPAAPPAPAPPAAFGTPLTGAQVGQVISAIEGRIGRKLTAAQSRTIRTQLQTRGQMLVLPAAGNAGIAGQIQGAVVSNGTVSFTTPTGSMTLYPGGGYTSSAGFASGLSSLPNVMTQGVLVIISSGLSFVLAILLLVAGIATTRNSLGARRLHLIYAYIKIPVGIAGTLAWGWLWYAFMRAFPAGGGGSKMWVVSAVFSVPALLGLAYPVGLLIVMRMRAVKSYYASVMTGGGV